MSIHDVHANQPHRNVTEDNSSWHRGSPHQTNRLSASAGHGYDYRDTVTEATAEQPQGCPPPTRHHRTRSVNSASIPSPYRDRKTLRGVYETGSLGRLAQVGEVPNQACSADSDFTPSGKRACNLSYSERSSRSGCRQSLRYTTPLTRACNSSFVQPKQGLMVE